VKHGPSATRRQSRRSATLDLDVGREPTQAYKFPTQSRFLSYLSHSGESFVQNSPDIRLPALRSLSISFKPSSVYWIEKLLQGDDLPFDQLEARGISFYENEYSALSARMYNAYTSLLLRCLHIKTIQSGESAAPILLKIIYDICRDGNRNEVNELKRGDHCSLDDLNDIWLLKHTCRGCANWVAFPRLGMGHVIDIRRSTAS
jgi:hypothetical protein